jgi:hypothetical protein
LPSSFNLLDDPDGSLHVSVKSWPFLDDLFFGQVGLLEVDQKFLDDLVAFGLIVIAVVDKIARDMHFNFCRAHPHLQQELIEIDVLWSDCVGVSIVADEVELELYNSEHGWFKHVLQEHPLLGVDHLVVAVLENLVAVDVFDIEVGVEAKPLLVLALVGDLNRE